LQLDRTHELTKVEILVGPEQKKLAGGFTGFRAAEKDEVSIAEKFKADVAKEIGATEIKSYEVKSVKTQVVAGVNYVFEVQADGSKLHVTIWGKLDKTHELTGVSLSLPSLFFSFEKNNPVHYQVKKVE